MDATGVCVCVCVCVRVKKKKCEKMTTFRHKMDSPRLFPLLRVLRGGVCFFFSSVLGLAMILCPSPGPRWLFHAEQAAHVGHELLQALEEGHLLLAVHGGRRAAGRQLVEGVGQPLVDDGVPLRRQQRLHQLRVLRLVEGKQRVDI